MGMRAPRSTHYVGPRLKGKTMADRRQFLFRVFETLLHNSIKTFKLDPRSLSGRHVDVLMKLWRQRAEAGELGASSLQKHHSMLKTFTAWIGKANLVKPLSAYFDDAALYSAATWPRKARRLRPGA
jgi:hypothetical protein